METSEYRTYRLWVFDQCIEFEYDESTGWVRAPGVVEFRAETLNEAKHVLFSLYLDDE